MAGILDSAMLEKLAAIVNDGSLAKSFNQAPNSAMMYDGRHGLNAIQAYADRSDNMYNIAMKEADFFMIRDIKDVKCDGLSFNYKVKTQNGDAFFDAALMENGIGKEVMGNWQTIAVPIKIYGAKTSVSHLMNVLNQGGAFVIDINNDEKEMVMTSIARSQENDAWFGLDYYIDSNGDIENLAFNTNMLNQGRRMNFRHATGIQAYIRSLNFSSRSIAPEKIGYGNIQSVVQDYKGEILGLERLDRSLEPVINSGGKIADALCSFPQLRSFRASFLPVLRGDINTAFSINGPDMPADFDSPGFKVLSSAGSINFRSLQYRKMQNRKPTYTSNAVGAVPSAPAALTLTPVASQGTSFKAGERVKIAVQANNIAGLSGLTYAEHTVTADGEGIRIQIPFVSYAERFFVYATRSSAAPSDDDLFFVGQAIASDSGNTIFLHKETIMSGLESVVLTPAKGFSIEGKDVWFRAVVGGKSLYELDLAFHGALMERTILSYFQFVCAWGRTYTLLDNVGADIIESKNAFSLLQQ